MAATQPRSRRRGWNANASARSPSRGYPLHHVKSARAVGAGSDRRSHRRAAFLTLQQPSVIRHELSATRRPSCAGIRRAAALRVHAARVEEPQERFVRRRESRRKPRRRRVHREAQSGSGSAGIADGALRARAATARPIGFPAPARRRSIARARRASFPRRRHDAGRKSINQSPNRRVISASLSSRRDARARDAERRIPFPRPPDANASESPPSWPSPRSSGVS